jgi:hypothetical protein
MPTGTPIATVSTVSGAAYARDADNNLRPLKPGDVLHEGETLVTENGAQVELVFFEGGELLVGGDRSIAISAELLSEGAPDATESAIAADTA